MGIPLTDIVTALLLGIGLSMDASAVSMTGGANAGKGAHLRAALLAALFFGAFQGGMLLAGGAGGESLKSAISGIDHWVAFILLGAVGGKMLMESRKTGEDKKVDLLDIRILAMLSVATSIDALAAGAGIAFADNSILFTASIVAASTSVISFFSVFIGRKYGCALEGKAEALGGVVLFLIGLHILLAHTAFS